MENHNTKMENPEDDIVKIVDNMLALSAPTPTPLPPLPQVHDKPKREIDRTKPVLPLGTPSPKGTC